MASSRLSDPGTVRRALLTFGLFRIESALVVALTLVLGASSALGADWAPGRWWAWLLFGVVGEIAIMTTTLTDRGLRRRLLEQRSRSASALPGLHDPGCQGGRRGPRIPAPHRRRGRQPPGSARPTARRPAARTRGLAGAHLPAGRAPRQLPPTPGPEPRRDHRPRRARLSERTPRQRARPRCPRPTQRGLPRQGPAMGSPARTAHHPQTRHPPTRRHPLRHGHRLHPLGQPPHEGTGCPTSEGLKRRNARRSREVEGYG